MARDSVRPYGFDHAIEYFPGVASQLFQTHQELQRDNNRGDGIVATGQVVGFGILSLGVALQNEFKMNLALGYDLTASYATFNPIKLMATCPVDNTALGLAVVTGSSLYGARLMSRYNMFPVRTANVLSSLSHADSYDPTPARRRRGIQRLGDAAMGIAATGAAFYAGERLDVTHAAIAATTVATTGWLAVGISRTRGMIQKMRPVGSLYTTCKRPNIHLENGKTIY